jgi:hypothetical protein
MEKCNALLEVKTTFSPCYSVIIRFYCIMAHINERIQNCKEQALFHVSYIMTLLLELLQQVGCKQLLLNL